MKITIVGSGYVGLSLATLLSQKHDVICLDIIEKKVEMINNRISPIKEEKITEFFNTKELSLLATTNKELAYKHGDLFIVATPTNYDENTHYFDTSSIDDAISNILKYNPTKPIIIKSTIPVGFTEAMRKKYEISNIYFSPEFLREGLSLYDNLHPSRIVVGDKGEVGKMFSSLLKEASLDEDTPVLLTESTEAEAIKLFVNTYLATRVAYFNELDSYAMKLGLNAKDIIEGISLDPRVGQGYNNPSFGYGGYCLPKDTKQLVANYKAENVSESLMSAVVESNQKRKEVITEDLLKYDNIGIYKTAMKANSDNNRASSIIDIIKLLKEAGKSVIIYEPTCDISYLNCDSASSLEDLVNKSDVIVANRISPELVNYKDKVYTRDIYGRDS